MKAFIGVGPHKLSATIEVVDDREGVLATGRFGGPRLLIQVPKESIFMWVAASCVDTVG